MNRKKVLLSAILFMAASSAWACPAGTVDMNNGVCASVQPSSDPVKEVEAVPSDEKPRKNQQPAWQTGEVHADLLPSAAVQDATIDRQKAQATEQGQKAAGL